MNQLTRATGGAASAFRRRPRLAITAGLAGAAGVLLVAAALWGMAMAGRAERLAADLRATGSSVEEAIADEDFDRLQRLSEELTASRVAAGELDRDLWPLKAAAAVGGWVPYLGDNVSAVPDITARLRHDLDAAVLLLDAADGLLEAYDRLPQDGRGLVTVLRSLPSEPEIARVRGLLSASSDALARGERKAGDINDGRLFGRLGDESRELAERERRLRQTVDWGRAATDSLLYLSRLGAASEPLVGILEDGGSVDRTALEAMAALEPVSERAAQSVSAAVRSTPEEVAASSIGRSLAELEPVLAALADTAVAGRLAWGVAEPALDVMEASEGGFFGENSALLSSLDTLAFGHDRLTESRDVLGGVLDGLAMESFETPAAAAAARSLTRAVGEVHRMVAFLADFSLVGAEMLGADGPRTYLVLGQTSDELRANGGFVSGAWTVEVDGGALREVEYFDIVQVDDFSNLAGYPQAPDLLVRHMDAPVWLLRDVTWNPDFPTSARAAAELFRLGQGEHRIDGVVALTQWALVRLGEGMGSVPTERGDIDPAQLMPTLEAGTDAEGREFTDVVFRGVIAGLSSTTASGRVFPIINSGAEIMRRKDMLIYLFDPELQSVIARAGWDGALNGTENDRVAVIDSNVGWSKVDRNIERAIDYEVFLDTRSAPTARLEVSYTNRSPYEARGCDLQSPIHGLTYEELKNACYWNLLRVYLPAGGAVTGNDPIPIPASSVYARLGNGVSGDDSVEVDFGPGGQFVSGLITVPVGQTVSAKFDLAVTESAFSVGEGVARYSLELPHQPGVLARSVAVTVNLPAGYEYSGGSHAPESVSGRAVTYRMTPVGDVVLTTTMRPVEGAVGDLEGPGEESRG